jgi:hypothetical protein
VSVDYRPVQEEINRGTPPDAICAVCPPLRLCVVPPAMTMTEVQHAFDAGAEKLNASGQASPQSLMMLGLILSSTSAAVPACPVLIAKLQGLDARQLTDGIRVLMRGEP